MRKEIIKGKLSFHSGEPEYTTIVIDEKEYILIEVIKSKLDKNYEPSDCFEWYEDKEDANGYDFEKLVSVRYGTSTKPIEDLDTLFANYVMQLEGEIELECSVFATDVTGYIWTTEEFIVGGHDIIDELDMSFYEEDKYLWLEIILHDEENKP